MRLFAELVNLTNHTYYNLAGYGSVESQVMTVMADQVTPTDVNQVPTGELTNVAGTALDFRNPKPIGRDLRSSEPCSRLRSPPNRSRDSPYSQVS